MVDNKGGTVNTQAPHPDKKVLSRKSGAERYSMQTLFNSPSNEKLYDTIILPGGMAYFAVKLNLVVPLLAQGQHPKAPAPFPIRRCSRRYQPVPGGGGGEEGVQIMAEERLAQICLNVTSVSHAARGGERRAHRKEGSLLAISILGFRNKDAGKEVTLEEHREAMEDRVQFSF